jgi:hypothetical protein
MASPRRRGVRFTQRSTVEAGSTSSAQGTMAQATTISTFRPKRIMINVPR